MPYPPWLTYFCSLFPSITTISPISPSEIRSIKNLSSSEEINDKLRLTLLEVLSISPQRCPTTIQLINILTLNGYIRPKLTSELTIEVNRGRTSLPLPPPPPPPLLTTRFARLPLPSPSDAERRVTDSPRLHDVQVKKVPLYGGEEEGEMVERPRFGYATEGIKVLFVRHRLLHPLPFPLRSLLPNNPPLPRVFRRVPKKPHPQASNKVTSARIPHLLPATFGAKDRDEARGLLLQRGLAGRG